MKTFDLTMRITANDNLTEKEIFERFEALLDAIPKDVNRKVFQGDCCLIETIVDEVK